MMYFNISVTQLSNNSRINCLIDEFLNIQVYYVSFFYYNLNTALYTYVECPYS